MPVRFFGHAKPTMHLPAEARRERRRNPTIPAPAAKSRLSEPPAVERDQPLPVPLGSRLVVAPALGEREAVMDAGIELDFARAAGFSKQTAQLLDHRQRRELVVLGAGDVELGLAFAQR